VIGSYPNVEVSIEELPESCPDCNDSTVGVAHFILQDP
jgi:hypothetical protein